MAIPEAPIPPQLVSSIITSFGQLTESNKAQVAATLAAAIIMASGRPHSIQQALDIVRDIQFAMYPAPQYGHYKEWEKFKDARLSRVHGPT
jgi:hypothetical protein